MGGKANESTLAGARSTRSWGWFAFSRLAQRAPSVSTESMANDTSPSAVTADAPRSASYHVEADTAP